MLSKFKSRKFLLALLADIVGIISLVASNGEGDSQAIASILLICISTGIYIYQEAAVDKAAVITKVGQAVGDIQKQIDIIMNNNDPLIGKDDTTEETK